MTDESNVIYLRSMPANRGVDPFTGVIRDALPDAAMSEHVEQAMAWLRENPGSDHLDAAYAVAQRSDTYAVGRYQWPEFVSRVGAEAGEAREAQRFVDRARDEAEAEREVER